MVTNIGHNLEESSILNIQMIIYINPQTCYVSLFMVYSFHMTKFSSIECTSQELTLYFVFAGGVHVPLAAAMAAMTALTMFGVAFMMKKSRVTCCFQTFLLYLLNEITFLFMLFEK